jgi:predicted component of type VI protein secretion system
MRQLVAELAVFHPKRFEPCPPYNHDEPLPCLRELDRRIRRLTSIERRESLEVRFVASPDGRPMAQLEEQHFKRPNAWYLAVQTKVEESELAAYVQDRDKFRLLPLSRADRVVWGLKLRLDSNPPSDLPPRQGGLNYFAIVLTEDITKARWEEAEEEKVLVLDWDKSKIDLADAQFTLRMTLPG